MHATHAMHHPGWHAGRCGPFDPRGAFIAAMSGRGGRGGPRHGHRHGGPFGGPPFGRGSWGGPSHRARRGDVRAALLALLAEEPRNGYQLMQEIERRSEGVWRPSPGSVYPALQQLEDEGLVRSEEHDGRKAFSLTDAGRAHVAEKRDELGTPWDTMSGAMPDGVLDLRSAIGELAGAAMQATQTGDAERAEKVQEILVDARRAIYRLLADE